jgi:hypothetical protein
MSDQTKQPINRRQLNVMIMLFSFVLLPFSGVLIHNTHGMSEREPLRHFAMAVHNFTAAIFLITCVIHLVANRRVLVKYITNKTAEYTGLKREAVIAFLFVMGLVGLFAMHAFHVR